MKQSVIKMLGIVSIGILVTGLMACGRENPLIKEDFISSMKSKLFLDGGSFPIRECAAFYSGAGKASSKVECDEWTKGFYKSLFTMGGVPSTTTLEDFRDPYFWKKINSK